MSETTAAAASAETKGKSASNKSAQVRRKYILFVGKEEGERVIYMGKSVALMCFIFCIQGNLSYDTTEGDLRDFFQDTSKIS